MGNKSHLQLLRALNSDAPEPGRMAVVTSLYSDDYIRGVRVLGRTLREHNMKHEMVVLYIPEQVSMSGNVNADNWLIACHA